MNISRIFHFLLLIVSAPESQTPSATLTFKQEPPVPLSGQSLLWSSSPESLANMVITGVRKNSDGSNILEKEHSNGWVPSHVFGRATREDRL